MATSKPVYGSFLFSVRITGDRLAYAVRLAVLDVARNDARVFFAFDLGVGLRADMCKRDICKYFEMSWNKTH